MNSTIDWPEAALSPMDSPAKVTDLPATTSAPAMALEMDAPNGVAAIAATATAVGPQQQPHAEPPVAESTAPVEHKVKDEEMAGEDVAELKGQDEEMAGDDATIEHKVKDEEEKEEDSELSSEESDSDEETAAPPVVQLTDANGRPLSDIEVAARYAAIEIQSMSSQLASTVVDVSRPAATPAVPALTTSDGAADMKDDEGDANDDTDEEALGGVPAAAAPASSDDDDSSDEEGDVRDADDSRKLRAEIEAAMEKEENRSSGPLKTANEVAAVAVREPQMEELTAECPIARCGVVLNVSRPGLIVTIKSDNGMKPLDEGSVLCLEDRTVLGCVDEIFGPVLMPMYLVRFETADKIPVQTDINKTVFYATEHTTYIIPDKIRDKGTDASNIFDEETDETIYSDDEAEAAAKRQNRKRNRGGDNGAPGAPVSGNGPTGPFSDYQGGGRHHGHGGAGRGRGRGRGGHGAGGQQHHTQQHMQQHHAPPAHVQSQPQGGYTRYTSPGYGQPGMPPYQPPPAHYQAPGAAPSYGAPPGPYPPPPVPIYGQSQYGAPPQHLQPYPPQAPPSNYYQQHQGHGYVQPPPPPPSGHYGPPPAYYQQPDPNAYGHRGQHPQPPPSGSYGPPGGRRH